MRDLKAKIQQSLSDDLILIIIGARQVGKTTLLKEIYNELLNNNKNFINLENPTFLMMLNEHPNNVFNITNIPADKKQVIFIDEIQYLKDPTNFLKYIYDEYKGTVKIIATGSSCFYMDSKFKDSLVGRKTIFNLYTLNFREFLKFKNESTLLEKENFSMQEQTKIEQFFSEYITYGGYPAVVLKDNIENKKSKLEEIGLDYIKKDIFDSKVQNQEKYFNILKIIAANVGNLLNSNEIAKTLKISTTSVENYLYIMQKSFHISLLRPFYKNVKKELTKMPKAYFLDNGLRNYFFNSFENIELRMDKGMFLENVVFRELLMQNKSDELKFWRTQDKNEVDFIVNEKNAYEVKFSKDAFNPNKYSKFTEAYPNINLDFIDYKDIIKIALKGNIL